MQYFNILLAVKLIFRYARFWSPQKIMIEEGYIEYGGLRKLKYRHEVNFENLEACNFEFNFENSNIKTKTGSNGG